MQFILILAVVLFVTGGLTPGALADGPDFKKFSEAMQKSKEDLRESLTAAMAKGRAADQAQPVAKEIFNDVPAALPARVHQSKKSNGLVCISEDCKGPC